MTAWLEQAWMVQYLDRQLAGEEAQWFETYAMDRPELLTTIEADTRLRDALAAAASIRQMEVSVDGGARPGGAAESDADSGGPGNAEPRTIDTGARARSVPIPIKKNPPRAQLGPPRFAPSPRWLSIAASLLLGVGVGWIGVRQHTPHGAPAVIASPTRIIYDTMRGGNTPARVEHADSHSAYVLIEIAVPLSAERITLDIGDGAEQELTRSADGFVTFLADRTTLAAIAGAHVNYSAGGRTQTRPLSLQSKGSLR
jgi:hypothetical protein